MTGKDLIELIKENELEDHDVNVYITNTNTAEEKQFELNSLIINPTKNTVAFGHK